MPSFIARCLHRTWGTVQSHLVAGGGLESTGVEWRVASKPSTFRRWQKKLSSSAKALRTAMAETSKRVKLALEHLDETCTRGDLVEALARAGLVKRQRKLEEVACSIFRLGMGRLV